MRKPNYLFAILIAGALVTSTGCRDNRTQYPANPTNNQVYYDANGNRSVWNSALGYWMIYSMVNGQQTVHHYYPSTGTYRNSSGQTVSRPSTIPAARKSSATRFGMSSKSSTSPKSSSSSKSGGFGSSGRSSSSS